MVTLTVAVAVAEPPAFVAVSVYVVVLPGNTWRFPVALIEPIAGSMRISVVSPVTFQRSVAACPRSMVAGFGFEARDDWLCRRLWRFLCGGRRGRRGGARPVFCCSPRQRSLMKVPAP